MSGHSSLGHCSPLFSVVRKDAVAVSRVLALVLMCTTEHWATGNLKHLEGEPEACPGALDEETGELSSHFLWQGFSPSPFQECDMDGDYLQCTSLESERRLVNGE